MGVRRREFFAPGADAASRKADVDASDEAKTTLQGEEGPFSCQKRHGNLEVGELVGLRYRQTVEDRQIAHGVRLATSE